MPAAGKGEGHKAGKPRPAPEKPPKTSAVGAPAPAPKSEVPGLSGAEPPGLPPFWVEWGRSVAHKWPLPVFFMAVLAAVVVYLARPRGETPRSSEQYVEIARMAFAMAVAAQDERGDLAGARDCLAAENVEVLAAEWRKRHGGPPAGGGKGAKREEEKKQGKAGGFHGVVPSYERAVNQSGEDVLQADDLAIIGESYYRLAKIKADRSETGRAIIAPAAELYRLAVSRLEKARKRVGEAADKAAKKAEESAKEAGRVTDRAGKAAAEARARQADEEARQAAAQIDRPEWRRRMRMLAECRAQAGDFKTALEELARLAQTLSAAQAGELRREKEPGAGGAEPAAGAGQSRGAAVSSGEWSLVYELMARCNDRSGKLDDAERCYRLCLEQGVGGLMAHQVRLRLAELIMAKAVAGQAPAASSSGASYEEVCRLAARVEQSDAPADLREDATFLRGRAAYRLGGVEHTPARAQAAYRQAASAFRYQYSPRRPYLDMSRVLLARSLFLAGERDEAREAREQLDTLLRIGAQPVIYACAEVSRADLLVESDPALALGGGSGAAAHGYKDAIRRIRGLDPETVGRLAPELAALLEDEHFVMLDPVPGHHEIPAGQGQLLRIARAWSARQEYDEAADVYRHILDAYPGVAKAKDRYHYLLGELYVEKAELMGRRKRLEEQRGALLAAARDFMCVPLTQNSPTPNSPRVADAYWNAGRCYFEARHYDGASRAFEQFTSPRFADDLRASEGLYLLGESLRRTGDYERAAEVFDRAAIEHQSDQFGYQAQLALGETYLALGRLDAVPEAKGDERRHNARFVFESIRQDARFTPESQVWMKALLRLGETRYLLGRAGMVEVGRLKNEKAEGEKRAAADQKAAEAREHLVAAAAFLDEFRERYPLSKYAPDPKRPEFQSEFYEFLMQEKLPVLHMLAMIRMQLGNDEEARTQFDEILKLTGEVRTLDRAENRAEAERYRRLAYGFKGGLEMKQLRFAAAADTYRQAYGEFARSPDGPWFAQGAAMALERSGGKDAALWYGRASSAYQERVDNQKKGQPAEKLDREWIVSLEDWKKHIDWAQVKGNG